MSGLQALKIPVRQLSSDLDEFEAMCSGALLFDPFRFRKLNAELSLAAVMHMGRRYLAGGDNGAHVYWTGRDGEEYDLGPLTRDSIMRGYPGFGQAATLALCPLNEGRYKAEHAVHPLTGQSMTIVTLSCGLQGKGMSFRTALRNAVLRRYVERESRTFFVIRRNAPALGELARAAMALSPLFLL